MDECDDLVEVCEDDSPDEIENHELVDKSPLTPLYQEGKKIPP